VNASPACRALYDEVVGFAYQHGHLMRLHQLTVDAYGAQHGGGGTPPIRLAYSLVGLHLALDHQLPGEQVRAAHTRMGKPGPTWPAFTPPQDVGAVTVLTVAELGARLASPAGHAAAVDSWARQTWRAWSGQRGEVEELTRRLLPDLVSG
jgi:hypothetical protein